MCIFSHIFSSLEANDIWDFVIMCHISLSFHNFIFPLWNHIVNVYQIWLSFFLFKLYLTDLNLWSWLWKESLNSDGEQFHQYQQNKLSPVNTKKDHEIWQYKFRSWLGTSRVTLVNVIPTLPSCGTVALMVISFFP